MVAADFDKLKTVDVRTVDISTLADIGKIKINRELPKTERLRAFVKEAKNPFCFICNGMVIKISYSNTNESLENKLAKLCMEMAEV